MISLKQKKQVIIPEKTALKEVRILMEPVNGGSYSF